MKNGKENSGKRSLGEFIRSLLGRKSDWQVISGYIIGDVNRETTVHVSEGASVAGDIFAPRVVVSGLVYGFIICRELIIEPSGQVWGDVLTVSYEVLPGGKIHGWISTLDEGTVELLIAGELVPSDIVLNPPDLPDGQTIGEVTGVNISNEKNHTIYRQLRSELAAALLARREIELSFERRLSEALQDTSGSAIESNDSDTGSNVRIDRTPVTGIDTIRKSGALKARLLEKDLRSLRVLLARIATVAYEYQLSYLWATANLESTRSVSGHQNDKIPTTAGKSYLDSMLEKASPDVKEWQRITVALRVQMAKQRSAHNQTKMQLEQKTKELDDIKRLARRRIKNLEGMIKAK
jgi:hypothetical protein